MAKFYTIEMERRSINISLIVTQSAAQAGIKDLGVSQLKISNEVVGYENAEFLWISS